MRQQLAVQQMTQIAVTKIASQRHGLVVLQQRSGLLYRGFRHAAIIGRDQLEAFAMHSAAAVDLVEIQSHALRIGLGLHSGRPRKRPHLPNHPIGICQGAPPGTNSQQAAGEYA